jgi:hypothetical protein
LLRTGDPENFSVNLRGKEPLRSIEDIKKLLDNAKIPYSTQKAKETNQAPITDKNSLKTKLDSLGVSKGEAKQLIAYLYNVIYISGSNDLKNVLTNVDKKFNGKLVAYAKTAYSNNLDRVAYIAKALSYTNYTQFKAKTAETIFTQLIEYINA